MANMKRGASPVYSRMQEELVQQMRDGRFKTQDVLPSENDLSAQYDISRGSVRTALLELQEKGFVYTMPGKGWFVKQTDPHAMVKEHSRIAFISPGLEDSDFQIYQGVEAVLNERGYILSIFNSQRDIGQENKNIRLLMEGKESGAIIFPNWGRANAEIIFELKMANYPFVLIDRYFRDLETDYVVTDNRRGGFMAAEHLIELGHRRIGILLGLGCTAIDDRLEGWREALARHGVAADLSLIRRLNGSAVSEGVEPSEGGYLEARELLKAGPTAIFATNDFLAQGCYRAAQEEGLSIPKDISLVGFDNQRFSEYLIPPMTTVAQPFYQLGRSAAEILIGRLEGSIPRQETQRVVLPPELIVRGSAASVGAR